MPRHLTVVGPATPESTTQRISPSLPTDLMQQAAGRLRVLAMLYAFVFFMAGVFPILLLPRNWPQFFGNFSQWSPSVISIAVALLVAMALSGDRVSLSLAMKLALVFEVASSYGIAMAEFIDPPGMQMAGDVSMYHGISWVAVWTLLFTIVVPSPPRRALLAALASVSAVPVTVAVLVATDQTHLRPDRYLFFFGLVLPYLLVVCMAYVGARVVYALGTEVKKARELGSYHLEEKLGQGGMGEVWRARHHLLARPAAIKLMRPALRGPAGDLARRFEREAQVIAGLRSPHTVNLFDFGIGDDGAFYYVMELLDGLDSDKLVRRFGPLPAPRAIHLLRQVCHSLSEAESQGLVHRDIKPANIFVCRYGEECDFVKVLDFGIVKASHDAPGADGLLTAERAVTGTPAFMAPEQVLGGGVDGRADLYATGCVAYWLLTGQLVFEAPTEVALMMHHARTPPTAPSTRTELPISPALDQLVLDCLAKDPAARPQSARELSCRLAEADGAGEWGPPQARRWWDAHFPVRA